MGAITLLAGLQGAVLSARAGEPGDALPPQIVHGQGLPGQTRPHTGYLDCRAESDNGIDLNQGITRVDILFSEPVFGDDSQGGVQPSSFIITQTGGAAAPQVAAVEVSGSLVHLELAAPITAVQEWTTIRAVVYNAAGVPILNLGDLGHAPEPDRIDIGDLPCDTNQDGLVDGADLDEFIRLLEGGEPAAGLSADYIDIDRDGTISPLDVLRFRQMIFGTGPVATMAWAGALFHSPLPGGCTPGTCPDGQVCIGDECLLPCGDVSECDDGDGCTSEACEDGFCRTAPADCDDGDGCTVDACAEGECQHTPMVCPEDEVCRHGLCRPSNHGGGGGGGGNHNHNDNGGEPGGDNDNSNGNDNGNGNDNSGPDEPGPGDGGEEPGPEEPPPVIEIDLSIVDLTADPLQIAPGEVVEVTVAGANLAGESTGPVAISLAFGEFLEIPADADLAGGRLDPALHTVTWTSPDVVSDDQLEHRLDLVLVSGVTGPADVPGDSIEITGRITSRADDTQDIDASNNSSRLMLRLDFPVQVPPGEEEPPPVVQEPPPTQAPDEACGQSVGALSVFVLLFQILFRLGRLVSRLFP